MRRLLVTHGKRGRSPRFQQFAVVRPLHPQQPSFTQDAIQDTGRETGSNA